MRMSEALSAALPEDVKVRVAKKKHTPHLATERSSRD